MTLSDLDLGWVVGFLEGEGCFIVQSAHHTRGRATLVRIVVAQVQRQPLDHLQSLVGGKINYETRRNPKWSPCYRWALTGQRAIDLINLTYPLLSPKRQVQAATLRDRWSTRLMTPEQRSAVNRVNGAKAHLRLAREA